MMTRVRIIDEAIYVSHNANNLGKAINLIIIPPGMSKANSAL